MRPLKPLVLVGMGAIAATAEFESACGGPMTTVYVTAPSSPTTETVYAVNPESSAAEAGAVALDAVTTIVTKSKVFVASVSIPQATAPANVYSFTEDNGTTTWLGGEAPPSSLSFLTSTAFITLQPVITLSHPVSEMQSLQSTTYVTQTLSSTITIIETSTLALPEKTFSTSPSTVKKYTGLAPNGWNATKIVTSKIAVTAMDSVKPLPFGSASRFGRESHSINFSRKPVRLLKVRQAAEEFISATIDGVVVSWLNNWNGPTPSIPAPTSSPSEATSLTLEATPTSVPVIETVSTPAPSLPTTAISSSSEVAATSPDASLTAIPVTSTEPASGLVSTATSSSSTMRVLSSSPTIESLAVTSSYASSISSIVSISLVSAAATATASPCGGLYMSPRFVIDFDDLPHFSTSLEPNDTDTPPIFDPYRKLYFEGHFGYVPPPTDPFQPHSPPQLAVYREEGLNITPTLDNTGERGSPDASLMLIGELGAGPRAYDSAYWIDAYSAWLGCANSGPSDCIITVQGYVSGDETSLVTQDFTQPPCPGLNNCLLALVEFGDGFRALTGLQIIATVDGKAVDWYMDDLALGWSNNTCAAQMKRSSAE